MNYVKVYDNIINAARNRVSIEGYFENHHVVPVSMGGPNSDDNVVRLTAREHYLCHWLLYKIYRNTSMTYAWYAMSNISLNGKRYTSHTFKYAKEAFIRLRSTKSENEDISNPRREGSSRGRPVVATCVDTGKVIVFDNSRWAAKCVNGDQSTITRCCANKSVMHKGYYWDYLDGMRKGTYVKTGIVRTKDSESILFKDLTDACINTDGSSKAHITSCCKGNRITHVGYTWNYDSGE